MKDLLELIQNIVGATVKESIKPVTVQTGIMETETDVKLDQSLTVTPTVSKVFEDGIEVHIEGTVSIEDIVANGRVTGDLILTRSLKAGDKVKIIKEDGTNKYYVAEQLMP